MNEQDAPARPAIGIDVGGTNITGGLIDKKGKIVARDKIDTEASEGATHVIDRISQCVEDLVKDAKISRKDICGVGLGVPGPVDVKQGRVLVAVNLRWHDVPVAAAVSDQVKMPVTLENDANVAAWGEYAAGAGRGSRAMLSVVVGTGIGGGLVFDGELHSGVFGTAGEIGHTIVQANAPYGSRTLEELASRTAIVNRLTRMINANHASSVPELAGKKWPRIRSKVLAKAFEAEDALTVRVISDAAVALGLSLASVVTLLSLDRVVVGGGLTEALNSKWIKMVREAFADAVFPASLAKECKVVESELEDDAGLIGAAMLARKRLG